MAYASTLHQLVKVLGIIVLACFSFDSGASIEDAQTAYRNGNPEKAAEILLPLASSGSARAQYIIGSMYYMGDGVKEDIGQAESWLSKSSAQGFPDAFYVLGRIYDDEELDFYNPEKATELFRKGAQLGHSESSLKLARRLDSSRDRLKHQTEIFELYEIAANSGDPDAQYEMGRIHYESAINHGDFSDSIFWLEKAIEQKHPRAHWLLGEMHLQGDGVEKDFDKSVAFFQYAAERDIHPAQFKLALSYLFEHGNHLDPEEAYFWFLLAAKGGMEPARQGASNLEELLDEDVLTRTKKRAQEWKAKD